MLDRSEESPPITRQPTGKGQSGSGVCGHDLQRTGFHETVLIDILPIPCCLVRGHNCADCSHLQRRSRLTMADCWQWCRPCRQWCEPFAKLLQRAVTVDHGRLRLSFESHDSGRRWVCCAAHQWQRARNRMSSVDKDHRNVGALPFGAGSPSPEQRAVHTVGTDTGVDLPPILQQGLAKLRGIVDASSHDKERARERIA